MKFLDKIFDRFVYWFDSDEETEQQRESRLRFLQGLAPPAVSMPSLTQSLSRRLKLAHNYRGLGTWEPRPDPFDPEQTIEVYIPALEEMSQNELGDIVAKRVAGAFKDTEPTFKTERIRYAVYRIAAFRYGSYGYVRKHDDLVKDVEPVFEACNVLINFVEQEIENSADPVDDVGLSDFIRAAQYLITMANRTYVSVVAQESIAHPYSNWMNSPASLPCWPGLAALAGKEAA
jgi:hypothetical protein